VRHAVLLVFAAAASAQSWQAEVNLATDRGIEHLLCTQCANGDFRVGYSGEYPMGPAALATYTLLKSGLPRQDPAIVRAFAFLRALPFKKVYSTATLIMALDARRDPAMDPWIAEAAAWIEENLDPDTGLWSYPGRWADLSNTHFAAYGLWLASAHGYRPSKRTWLKVMRATVKLQNRDGGFGYRPRDRPESAGSMTVAGITVLTIVRKALSGSYAARTAKKPLARAWGWLDRVFSATGNPRGGSGLVHHGEPALWYYYYLFGLERIAALSNRTQIGGRDWYREGALQLLRREKDGDWPGAASFENTCFALLFLRRATFTQLSGDSPLAGAAGAVHWRHAMHTPSEGWTEHDYDDSQWAVGAGAFGAFRSGPVRTEWKTSDLWLRKRIESAGQPLRVFVRHDGDTEIRLDGQQVATLPGSSKGKYVECELGQARRGPIVLAVHCRGGVGSRRGFFDLRLMDLGLRAARAKSSPFLWWKSRPAVDVPFLKKWDVNGPLADPLGERLWELPPRTRTWRTVRAETGFVDLGRLTRLEIGSIYYARRTLQVDRTVDAALWIDADDGFMVVLDGQVLYAHHTRQGAKPDAHVVPLALVEGAHLLELRVVNKTGNVGFYARIARRDGRPATEIH
jgi:hypothetical protein